MSEWIARTTSTGERYLLCPALEKAGLPHAFTLRRAGRSPEPSPRRPPEEVTDLLGLKADRIARPEQVHGAVVARPLPRGKGTDPARADAVVVSGGDLGAAVATADCIGAIVLSPGAPDFAVIHAGWRGTLAGVTAAAIRILAAESGEPTSRMIMAMGPSIGPCCYEVGEEVVEAYRPALPKRLHPRAFRARGGRFRLDLVEVNRAQALAEGLPGSRIHASGVCTACRSDLCWSYRREGRMAGRMWTVAGLGEAGRRLLAGGDASRSSPSGP
jgi:YfiH family protein